MKRIVTTFLLLALLGMAKANINQVEDPVVMTEKVVNPNGSQNEPHRSSEATLVIYQSRSIFYFGESFAGCSVTLFSNNVLQQKTNTTTNRNSKARLLISSLRTKIERIDKMQSNGFALSVLIFKSNFEKNSYFAKKHPNQKQAMKGAFKPIKLK